jgi:hypothetical protein
VNRIGWQAVVGSLAIFNGQVCAEGAGGIAGKLFDPNGNLITLLDADVSVTNTSTGEVQTAAVRDDGTYFVTDLAPGVYDLHLPIACCMYRTYEQKTVTIPAGETVALDLSIAWAGNLGTIGDDPGQLGMDMRRRAGNVEGPAPRMPNGKIDFSGMWYNVPDPPGARGEPPMQQWAADIQAQLREINNQGSAAYCLPQHAVPTALLFPYKVVQTDDLMIHLTEFTTPGYRQVFLDGRPHPPANEWNPAWHGHSVGSWEGDTLVIDSVGFNEITPGFGVHSEQLHVVERWRRPSLGRLEVEIDATDLGAWDGEYRFTFVAGLIPDEEILEFVCPENNLDAMHNGEVWRGRP